MNIKYAIEVLKYAKYIGSDEYASDYDREMNEAIDTVLAELEKELPLKTKLEMFYDFLYERGIANQLEVGIDTVVQHFIDEKLSNKEQSQPLPTVSGSCSCGVKYVETKKSDISYDTDDNVYYTDIMIYHCPKCGNIDRIEEY